MKRFKLRIDGWINSTETLDQTIIAFSGGCVCTRVWVCHCDRTWKSRSYRKLEKILHSKYLYVTTNYL